MDIGTLGAFVAASFALAAAPGPDIIFVTVQSAVCGARAGLYVVLGLMCGLVLQTCAASFGIAAVVVASPVLFWGIRLLGAAYLLYLAWHAWRATGISAGPAADMRSGLALTKRGFIMNITNPKVQIFFLAFLPQFVSAGVTGVQAAFELALLGMINILCSGAVMASAALFAGTVALVLRRENVRRIMNRTAAVIFVLLAVGTVLSGR